MSERALVMMTMMRLASGADQCMKTNFDGDQFNVMKFDAHVTLHLVNVSAGE